MAERNQYEKAAYFERYKDLAIEQQIKYGIPASVTLAQMALENDWGKGRALTEGNNAFCVKGTWNGHYVIISDDGPNEKFKAYDTLEQSFEDHSKVLMSPAYAHCRGYSSTDYESWCKGLVSGETDGRKYATAPGYDVSLLDIIRRYDLSKYDQEAVLKASGQHQDKGRYCMPLEGEKLVVTELYGVSPKSYRDHVHHGIDLRASFVGVYATEDNGRVVAVNENANQGSGKYVTVEYGREDGGKYTVSYCHLNSVDVKNGDVINAGTRLGESGNTGNSTYAHLHLTVKYQQSAGAAVKYVNPLDYLAEIAVRGKIVTPVVSKASGQELLAERKEKADVSVATSADLLARQEQERERTRQEQDEQNRKMMALNDRQRSNIDKASDLVRHGGSMESLLSYMMSGENGMGMRSGGGLISGMLEMLFTSALMMAFQLDRNNSGMSRTEVVEAVKEEQKPPVGEEVIVRTKDVDPAQLSAMNFENEYPESVQQGQGQSARLA